MDKQKQIEEMSKVIEEAVAKARRTLGGNNNIAMFYATILTNAGYRKITESEFQKYCAYKIIEPQIRGCLDRERELQKQVAEQKEEIERLTEDLSNAPDPFPCKIGSGCESAGKACYDCPNNRYIEQFIRENKCRSRSQ